LTAAQQAYQADPSDANKAVLGDLLEVEEAMVAGFLMESVEADQLDARAAAHVDRLAHNDSAALPRNSHLRSIFTRRILNVTQQLLRCDKK
jgi:hypothetical protein